MDSKNFILNTRWLIFISIIARCIVACAIELGNDEVYYYTYAAQMDWNYFDHPPLVAVLIKLFTINLTWVNDFSMRAGAIVSAGIATYLIAITGRLIKNERTGYIAAILYNASLYTGVIAGIFILPDSPAMIFWLLSIYSMVQIIKPGNNASNKNKNLLLIGIWIGLATMSKVHGLFLWAGFFGYIILYDRSLLKKYQLYIAFLFTCLIISPVLLWNIKYDFVTWRFHGERVAIHDSSINISSFFTALFGQLFYNNPVSIILYILAVIAIYKRKTFLENRYIRLLLFTGIPIIIVTQLVSLFKPVLPHWSGPGFISLMLITAVWLDETFSNYTSKRFKRMLASSLLLTLFIIVAGVLVIQFYPGTLGQKNGIEKGKGDITLDMYGWEELLPAFDSIRKRDIDNGIMKADAALLVNKWFPGGHLCFYITRPLSMRIVGDGNLNDLHKFAWLNQKEGRVLKGQGAYFIAPSNYFTDPVQLYADQFENIMLINTISQTRNGNIARAWYIYRLKNARRDIGYILPEKSIGWK